ncbi:MAG: phenylacetate--CoA ligase family protein, partial [Candidatus Rokuibacteriota bacterium]
HAGMTEMGAYGFECAAQSGLHVNEAEFIAEILDPVTGRPADEGELILSNLGRAGSPLLRYRTGDRVRRARTPCACGRASLRLEGGILGRIDDMLIVRGVNVFPSALEGIVRRFPAVDEFLIEVYRRGQLDEVRLLLEVRGHAGPVVAAVQEAVRVDLGIRVEAVPVPGQSLPRYELKARRLVRRADVPQ